MTLTNDSLSLPTFQYNVSQQVTLTNGTQDKISGLEQPLNWSEQARPPAGEHKAFYLHRTPALAEKPSCGHKASKWTQHRELGKYKPNI